MAIACYKLAIPIPFGWNGSVQIGLFTDAPHGLCQGVLPLGIGDRSCVRSAAIPIFALQPRRKVRRWRRGTDKKEKQTSVCASCDGGALTLGKKNLSVQSIIGATEKRCGL
jgi:hypothetical protein